MQILIAILTFFAYLVVDAETKKKLTGWFLWPATLIPFVANMSLVIVFAVSAAVWFAVYLLVRKLLKK